MQLVLLLSHLWIMGQGPQVTFGFVCSMTDVRLLPAQQDCPGFAKDEEEEE